MPPGETIWSSGIEGVGVESESLLQPFLHIPIATPTYKGYYRIKVTNSKVDFATTDTNEKKCILVSGNYVDYQLGQCVICNDDTVNTAISTPVEINVFGNDVFE